MFTFREGRGGKSAPALAIFPRGWGAVKSEQVAATSTGQPTCHWPFHSTSQRNETEQKFKQQKCPMTFESKGLDIEYIYIYFGKLEKSVINSRRKRSSMSETKKQGSKRFKKSNKRTKKKKKSLWWVNELM